MIKRQFFKVRAVWERLGGSICEGIKRSSLQGAYLDENLARLKVPCEVIEGEEVKPWVVLPQLGATPPTWFEISLAVPGPKGWAVLVGEGKVITPHFNQRVGKWLLGFRNGTVIRFHGRKLVADYLAVVRKENRHFLLQRERVAIDIPHYVRDKATLSDFLGGVEVEEEIKKIAVELFEPDRISNPQWQRGLEEVLWSKSRPEATPRSVPPTQPVPPVPAAKDEEKRRGKKIPLRADDELKGNARGKSLRDFRREEES